MMKTAIKHKSRHLRRFLKANEAVSALEYALLVGVIAVGVVGALITFGGNIETAITDMGGEVTAAATAASDTDQTA